MQLDAAGWKVERQYQYAPPRKFAADLFVAGVVLVEVQGGIYSRQAHGSISGVLKDNERLNEAAIAGLFMMRVTPDQVDSGEALMLVERFLAHDPEAVEA